MARNHFGPSAVEQGGRYLGARPSAAALGTLQENARGKRRWVPSQKGHGVAPRRPSVAILVN
eukprot:11226524-Lingulodinium_polyedra.AAC.1